MIQPFIFRGKTYKTKNELLRSLEKEFEYLDTSYTVFGKRYNTLKEVANDFNINVKRLREYIKKNKSLGLEFIIKRMTSGKALGLYSVDFLGNEFSSASALCRHWRISQSTYFNRLYVGSDLESLIMGKTNKQKIHFLISHKDCFTQEQFNFYMDKYAKEVK